MSAELYIGVLSGTSMDALDAVLLSVDGPSIRTEYHHALDYPPNLKSRLRDLCAPGQNEIERYLELDQHLAQLISQCVNELITACGAEKGKITAIGSHGQTIRHLPNPPHHTTLQIGNPSLIAELTGLTTVADFRRADMACGGQGAPMVCGFHQQLFQSESENRAIINIGGISNITILSGDKSKAVIGYDIGTGNTLLDLWCEQHTGNEYDDQGRWAASGTVMHDLLDAMLTDSYIAQTYPKSTGIEYFNAQWLDHYLNSISATSLDPVDIQRTLLEFTAQSIANAVTREQDNPIAKVLICGGGARNSFLMQRLSALMPDTKVDTTLEFGIDPQHVEAAAFAWLAHQTIKHLPGNVPAVTGASKAKILGGVYLP